MRSTDTAPVVVGVNGTAAGLAAVRLAARESASRGQPLRVVHAFAWPSYDPSAGVPYDELRRQASDVLARAVVTATRCCPAARVSGYLVDGPPTRVLLQQSRTASLLVLGDDDPGATVRLPTDSVLVQAVARSRCPVLVARGVGRSDGPVVVGVDGSAAARLALRYALAEAARRHAVLEVLHVREPEEGADVPDEDEARHVLDGALADVGLPGAPSVPPVRAHAVGGEPAAVLAQASTRARLLVVGPSGTDGRFGALLGSVAQTVLRHSACPTIFVHGGTASAGGGRPER